MDKKILILLLSIFLSSCSSIKIAENVFINTRNDLLFEGGDIGNTNISKTDSNIKPPFKLLWDYKIEAGFPYNSILVTDYIAFVSTLRSEIFAIDLSSGKRLGDFTLKAKGSDACALIYRDNLIRNTYDDEDSYLLSYNYITGETKWIIDFRTALSSGVLYNDLLYVSSRDGKIFSVEPVHGKVKDTFYTKEKNLSNSFFAKPVIDNNKIFCGNINGFIYCYSLSSKRLEWKFKTEGPVYCPLSVYKNLVFFGCDDRNFYCIDTSGNLLWKKALETKFLSSSTFFADFVITAGIDGNVYCLDINSGNQVWKFGTRGTITATPFRHQDMVFIGSFDGNLYCLDANNGSKLWSYKTGGRIRTTSVVWNTFILTASDDKRVYCFK